MKLFAFDRPPRRQNMSDDLIVIVSVHRLTELDHHEVRHVDDIIDRSDPRAFQSFLHPRRRRRELYISQHPRGESRAQLGRVDADFNHVGGVSIVVFVDGDRRQFEGLAGDDRHFVKQSEHAEAIAAIGSQLELENDIVEPEHTGGGNADRSIVGQNVNASDGIVDVDIQLVG